MQEHLTNFIPFSSNIWNTWLGIVNAKAITVKMYKTYFYRAQLFLKVQNLVVAGFLFFLFVSANAATWYVDSGATGANNGTSWANAWTSLSSASGSSVSAGDMVYISGGPAGSSTTYNIGSYWTPKSGASGNRITYQIGQDSSHNGTAKFTSTGGCFNNIPSYFNVVGDAGDGVRHFVFSGANNIGGGSFSQVRIAYCDFGQMVPDWSGAALYAGNVSQLEFDHNKIYTTGNTADAIFHIDSVGGSTYDDTLVHDNEMYCPASFGSGYGSDGMVISGTGFSLYNNVEVTYANPSYTGGQHADGWQTSGATYVKIYNNFIYGFGDIGLYGGCWGNAVSGGPHTFAHYRCFNNIVDSAAWNAAGCIDVSADNGTGSTFSDCLVYNNLCRQPSGSQGPCFSFGVGVSSGSWTQNGCSNNICIGAGVSVTGGAVFPNGNNPQFTDAQAASLFKSFVANSTNCNWHLTATATALIGKGANFYSIFTTDKDGNPRSPSGAWDIGPYNSGSSVANTNPAIVVAPTSIDFGTVPANTSTNLTLTVQNTGGGILTGSASASAPFSIVSGGTYNLSSNQSQTVSVKFNPTTAGTYNQTVSFTGGNGGSASATGSAYAVLPGLSFNAADGTIVAPFAVTTSSLVPAGSYVSQASATGLSGSGEAIYGFSLVSSGSYVVSALVNAPDSSANSFYVSIDSQPTDPTMIWDPPVTVGFANQLVSWRGTGTDTNNQFAPQVFNLSAGTHQLIVRGREAGAQLASLTITPYVVPPAPTGLRVIGP